MAFWKPGSTPIDREASGALTPAPLARRRAGMKLTIASHRREILYALEKHRVVVIAGETGSGKTTQIPQYLLHACLLYTSDAADE